MSNEPCARHSRRPIWADSLLTNGFAVTPLSPRPDFSLDEERTGKDLGSRSVDVDSPRAKRRKETAQATMPAATSASRRVPARSSSTPTRSISDATRPTGQNSPFTAEQHTFQSWATTNVTERLHSSTDLPTTRTCNLSRSHHPSITRRRLARSRER